VRGGPNYFRKIKRAHTRYDRDIKEITVDGEIIYKPRYDTKHTKRQRCQIRFTAARTIPTGGNTLANLSGSSLVFAAGRNIVFTGNFRDSNN